MNLLVIGGGNMATALIGGLLSGKAPIQRLHVIEPATVAQEKLQSRFSAPLRANGVEFSMDAATAPFSLDQEADNTWVVLAVKPQQMRDSCETAEPSVRTVLTRGLLLSIAAGVTTEAIARWTGNHRIVRAMPNTPALVAQGVTGLFAHSSVSTQARAQAEALVSSVGKVVWLTEESLMDAVTALSGSGPAYVFRFIEALVAAGEQMGLSADQSLQLAVHTMKGALALLESSGESPAGLREKVTSKGGTTAAALTSLERDQFMRVVSNALLAARDRGADMSREFG